MSDPKRLCALLLLGGAALLSAPASEAAGPPKEPAEIRVDGPSEPLEAGASARFLVRLEPKPGIKINRYPRLKLEVPAELGIHEGGKSEVGRDRPPTPDELEDNYFAREEIPALEIAIPIEAGAAPGTYELEAKLVYFYCVTKSGFCAPSRTTVPLHVDVR